MTEKFLQYGVLADGPGEDLVFFKLATDGSIKEMAVQPKDTNILAGTTRQSLIDYSAPYMGIRVVERPVTIDDLRNGRYQSMCMVGNAVGFAPGKVLMVYEPGGEKIEEITLGVSEGVRRFGETFNAQLRGDIEPFDPNLLTKVEFSPETREALDNHYPNWI